MSRYSDHDGYLDPGSGILRNRFGITDAAVLEATEADLVAARSRELVLAPIPGKFDLFHLQAMHRYLFGDLYEWAGQLRTVDISKGGHMFAHHGHIASAANSIFEKLAKEKHLGDLDIGMFCERTAYFIGEINALHPFREGNRRTQREFVSQLATQNNFYLDWNTVSESELLQASIESFHGKLIRLASILEDIAEPQ